MNDKVAKASSENLMIIRGLAIFAAKPINLFQKSSAAESFFFWNPQLVTRTFLEIHSSVIDLFLELPARDPEFKKKERVAVRIC